MKNLNEQPLGIYINSIEHIEYEGKFCFFAP